MWSNIESRLPLQSTSASLKLTHTANDNSTNRWRAVAVSAIAATFVLAAGLTLSLTRTTEPLVIAVLVNETGEVQAVVEDFGNERATVRMLADFAVPGDKTIQVWTLSLIHI